jgi:hypothetical protein
MQNAKNFQIGMCNEAQATYMQGYGQRDEETSQLGLIHGHFFDFKLHGQFVPVPVCLGD